MVQSYTITAQEYRLLDLIASKEANPRAPDVYMSLWPSTFEPELTQMTLSQVDEFQTYRIRTAGGSAAGRYQFIQDTLRGLINSVGLAGNLVFNNVLQDYLGLQLLLGAKLRQWQDGTLSWSGRGFSTNDPDAAFQVYLARVWAAIPVPANMQGHKRQVNKGESYYAGDGLNSAGMNADAMYRELKSLRQQGPRETFTLDLETGSRSHPITADTPWSQAQVAAGGGQTYYGGSSRVDKNTFSGGPVADGLPPADDPYVWDTMDLLDNRYDFRTGKKVRDLIYNGVDSVAVNSYNNGNARPPVPDIGNPIDGLNDVLNFGYGPNQVDPGFQAPIRNAQRAAQTANIESRLADQSKGIQRGF